MELCIACKNPVDKCDCFKPFKFVPEYKRIKDKLKLKKMNEPVSAVKNHGLYAHVQHKCRCDVCVKAWEIYYKDFYEKRKLKRAKAKEERKSFRL